VCTICGNGIESGHHAVVQCTKSNALWHEMRSSWRLPEGSLLRYTGPDWLPLLLGRLSKEEKARSLLVMWRAWHMRNDIIFGAGQESVKGSGKFLENYVETLGDIKKPGWQEACVKEKGRLWMNLQRAGALNLEWEMKMGNAGDHHRWGGSCSIRMPVFAQTQEGRVRGSWFMVLGGKSF
jgi:hypothetical protein